MKKATKLDEWKNDEKGQMADAKPRPPQTSKIENFAAILNNS